VRPRGSAHVVHSEVLDISHLQPFQGNVQRVGTDMLEAVAARLALTKPDKPPPD
jgi:hypothetical protein